ncbi:MAG: protein-glutamate O-methyltransferase CheR [Myxococcales bacterium FL481]|nr:MAG: protein-glutamate O-methyltransferase CheR [Myxococcales bacterium FL481]
MRPEHAQWACDLVRRRIGMVIDPTNVRVKRALSALAHELGHASVDSLIDAARTRRASIEPELIAALTNNETRFFRNPAAFAAVRSEIPRLRELRSGGSLRVWSAACSSGQEAYSVAVTLGEAGLDPSQAQVLGTDASREAVARARRGHYTELEAARGLPASVKTRWFERADAGWQASEPLRRFTQFRSHNLLHRPAAGSLYELVMLCNVLIYFDDSTRERILGHVAGTVTDGGLLGLGPGDPAPPGFVLAGPPAASLYRRQATRRARVERSA